jgi:hypothetical protein
VEKHCAGVRTAVNETIEIREIYFYKILARNRKTARTWRIDWRAQNSDGANTKCSNQPAIENCHAARNIIRAPIKSSS